MDAGTKTLPMKALSRMMEPGAGKRGDVESTRRIFREGQLDADIQMLDTEGDGVAIIAKTANGWLVRINIPKQSECLDLARTLLAKVRA